MATMFGRFEVQSELSKSETALIYKVMDTETNQVVALKTQSLAPLGELAERFVDALITEGESTRELVSQNIAALYGAGEIEGQFCAAMEYIQGNSVAGMLARNDGFSIWDLLDITRQVCAGLEHAAAKNVTHYSLEPAKIMVQWDGTVKILGYGISNMSLIQAEAGKSLGRLMPYCSPEQIRGEGIDVRSNLFTLGAILYEMVAGQKAFDAEDPVALVRQIENETPVDPSSVNVKIQPGVSAVILKALAKDPAERYQSARELLQELETCKENGKKGAPEAAKVAAVVNVAPDPEARSASARKFVAPVSRTLVPSMPKPAPRVAPTPASSPEATVSVPPSGSPRALSAAAGAQSGSNIGAQPNAKPGTRVAAEFDVNGPEYQAARSAVMSSAPVAPVVKEPARRAPKVTVDPPKVTVDPMMAAPAASGTAGKSFSDLAEMPPLKEVVFAPPSHEVPETPLLEAQVFSGNAPAKSSGNKEKLKIQTREVAENAIRQIVTIPPRLMLFSILGAVGLILVIAVVVLFHVRSEDDDGTAASHPVKAVEQSNTVAQSSTPAHQQPQAEAQEQAVTQAPLAIEIKKPGSEVQEAAPNLSLRQSRQVRKAIARRSAPAALAAPALIAGQAVIDSNPQGAQFQVDEKTDASWVTPFTLAELSPGRHIIAVSKAGYTSEIRSIEVFPGTKSSLSLRLSPLNALMVVSSTPNGANVIIDGKPTGKGTPAQFAVEKGSHTILLRKQGYLDESVTVDLSPAQNFQYSPQLRALGNTADMRTVGKIGKLFGRGGDSTAGMGAISVHTQPKGAQIAINQSMLDKTSPVDVMLGPGNYVIDITMTGFAAVHKVVSVDKGGKVAVDEILVRQ